MTKLEQAAREAISVLNTAVYAAEDAHDRSEIFNAIENLEAALAQQEKPEPVAVPFNVWSPIDDGENWYEHPADAHIIEDILGSDAKVGDEYELTACYSVPAKYRIILDNGDGDFEVECISHTKPPRREWVSLTEWQISDLYQNLGDGQSFADLILMAQEKLKELNHGH